MMLFTQDDRAMLEAIEGIYIGRAVTVREMCLAIGEPSERKVEKALRHLIELGHLKRVKVSQPPSYRLTRHVTDIARLRAENASLRRLTTASDELARASNVPWFASNRYPLNAGAVTTLGVALLHWARAREEVLGGGA